MEKLSEKIKELRKKKGWTQEDLARKIGVSLSSVNRWEKQGGQPVLLARRQLDRIFKKEGISNESLADLIKREADKEERG